MLRITDLKVENLSIGCITDEAKPLFSFRLESDKENDSLKSATFSVNGWQTVSVFQAVRYSGKPLSPYSRYILEVRAISVKGEEAVSSVAFETGRLNCKWDADWITDGSYVFKGKGCSPSPMYFRKTFNLQQKTVSRAVLYATSMGVYTFYINGKRVGEDYFTPGFTSYKNVLQYQCYDITKEITSKNDVLTAVVAGGWAVGDFTYGHKNRVSADRQALLSELRVEYSDGEIEVIPTDCTWRVATNGALSYADLYDGEIFDATVKNDDLSWHSASIETLRVPPKKLRAEYGATVTLHEEFAPLSHFTAASGEEIYDFGQNIAGIVRIKIKNAKEKQKLTLRHAEILLDGELYVKPLRRAKATIKYVAEEGDQEYTPSFTYMGFRYVGLSGDIKPSDVELSACALYSRIEETGDFVCSDERLNRLQSNIKWSAKSNFVDIPTDCPQRDERMGWTGDISVFSSTACYNFDMNRFLDKWLKDVKFEQLPSGGIPNTVPSQGHGFPITMPTMAVDFWGDCCINVPYAVYTASGDKQVLENMYSSMKKYLKACLFWAGLFSFGKRRYIWHTPSILHFGDWVAPDADKMSEWQSRSKWTATASIAGSARKLSLIAGILGYTVDEQYFNSVYKETSEAYETLLTDGGHIKKEFQTAYVLPLYFKMLSPNATRVAAERLNAMVIANGYRIGTGFPGTPYILFALADNGYADTAYKMLLCEECPSWLFEVKAGATTIWERFDALRADGTLNSGDKDGTNGMISFNHYAFGAVGDFLYRRVLGVEAIEGGYKTFKIQPLVNSKINSAKGHLECAYGRIAVEWKIEDAVFILNCEVPFGTVCHVLLPSGARKCVGSGKYVFSEEYK